MENMHSDVKVSWVKTYPWVKKHSCRSTTNDGQEKRNCVYSINEACSPATSAFKELSKLIDISTTQMLAIITGCSGIIAVNLATCYQ